MATTYKVGDVVRLVSGGIWMTVEGFDDEAGNLIRCKWFEGKDRHEQVFAKELIQQHPASKRPATV
jgi:uncharacterized protein YodC (DUF2158 family)